MRLLWLMASAVLAFPGAASAATVAIEPGDGENVDQVVYRAADGETNVLTAFYSDPDEDGDGEWRFTDGAGVVAGEGCTQVDARSASCSEQDPERYIDGLRLAAGDGDDRLSIDTDTEDSGSNVLSADGGPGDDRLTAGSNAFTSLAGGGGDDRLSAARKVSGGGSGAILSGGPGADLLIGSRYGDELSGGGGRDQLYGRGGGDRLIDGDRDGAAGDGGPGPDLLHGGTSGDSVIYTGRTRGVVVDLASRGPQGAPGENDTVIDVESVAGGRGPDRLLGDQDANGLSGGGGDDRLVGRGGDDQFTPGGGMDVVRCGAGTDNIGQAKRTTLVPRDCETLSWGDTSFRPYPARISGDRLMYEVMCPYANSDDEQTPCRGSVRLTETTKPRRLIAFAPIRRAGWGWNDGPRELAVPLTAAGRRLAGRRDGVVVTVHFHFDDRKGPSADDLSWRIRLVLR